MTYQPTNPEKCPACNQVVDNYGDCQCDDFEYAGQVEAYVDSIEAMLDAEERLRQAEEFTTCPAHPAQMVEYFTDCPRCMADEFHRQEGEWFEETDPFCLPATSDGSVDETRWV